MKAYLLLLALSSAVLGNGPVNTDNSVPWAGVNEDGDSLAIGNIKIVLNWQKSLYATFKFNQDVSDRSARYTGGIRSANINATTTEAPFSAIACSSYETWMFSPSRSREAPAGSWKLENQSLEPRLCAMTTNGQYAVYYPNLQKLEINGKASFLFNLNIGGQKSDMISIGESFLVLSNSGMAQIVYREDGQWKQSAILSHPYRSGSWSDTTRFVASSLYLIKTDSEQTDLLSLTTNFKSASTLASATVRLPVNPCNPNEVCVPWISTKDQSWIISGFWGHYLGQGKAFVRLALPLSSTGRSGVAIGHQGLNGHFIYLGNDDGDTGLLKHLPLSASTPLSQVESATSWFVWEKTENNDNSRRKDIFIPLTSSGNAPRGFVLRLVEGPIPSKIPSSWAAYEPSRGKALDTHSTENQSSIKEFHLPFFRPERDASSADSAWWPGFLGVQESWNLAQQSNVTASIVRMGVVDSGALMSHSALKNGLFINSKEIPSNKADDDDNNYIDDISGYDFVQENASVIDMFGHGTHVAGLLIGQDKSTGILAPASKNGKLIVARALDRYGKSNSIDLARALYYVMEEDVEVINCSWGGGSITQALTDVFAALKQRGVIIFSSAGNDGLNTDPPSSPEVPKVFDGVISVGAISSSRSIPRYSNYGKKTVNFFAPGDKILSSTIDGNYGVLSGTSMASPVALSSFSWIYGLLKGRCQASGSCAVSKEDLQSTALKILCDTSNPRGVEGKSMCGVISLIEATKAALSYPL